MSILREHFERKAAAQAKGLIISEGLYMDVAQTLLVGLNEANLALISFAEWNAWKKYLGKNHIFSRDAPYSARALDKAGVTIATMKVEEVEHKQRVYNEAYTKQCEANNSAFIACTDKDAFIAQPHHMLEFVFDDQGEYMKGMKDAPLVLTCLDPRSLQVRKFLAEEEYLNFRP